MFRPSTPLARSSTSILAVVMLGHASLGAGCAEDDGITDSSAIVPVDAGSNRCGPDVDLELGTGAREFMPVDDGDTVHLYRGPQGGYMIYLSVRARGIDPSDATVCYTETFTSGDETGEVFGEGCWRVKLTNDLGDGRFERVGVWGEVDERYWTSSFKIKGKRARVDVTISDPRGCSASDGWDIHIHELLGT
jgi:hypothetical protein